MQSGWLQALLCRRSHPRLRACSDYHDNHCRREAGDVIFYRVMPVTNQIFIDYLTNLNSDFGLLSVCTRSHDLGIFDGGYLRGWVFQLRDTCVRLGFDFTLIVCAYLS